MSAPTGSTPSGTTTETGEESASRERILAAAGDLFAERGFDATPTSRIAEHADVPKGLIHYYFRRKQDLLVALVDRLPDERIDDVAAEGDLTGSLRRLVHVLDERFESSVLLSHLLWREADTHAAVRDALQARFDVVVERFREVIATALAAGSARADVRTAALLLARAVHHRHSVSRHEPGRVNGENDLGPEIDFVASALEGRGG